MTSIIHTDLRQSLIDHVNNVLVPKGFKKNDNSFVLEFDHTTPGGGMYVNGYFHKAPDHVTHYIFSIKLLGTGSVSDDKSCEEFECIEFNMQEGQGAERSIVVGVYYEQPDEFNEYLNTYLGI